MAETGASPAPRSQPPDRRERPLRRDPAAGIVGGRPGRRRRPARLGRPWLVRVLFLVGVVVTGGLAARRLRGRLAADPGRRTPAAAPRPAPIPGRGAAGSSALGVGLLTPSALLVFRELGIWWSDALVWPLVLAVVGATLLWAQSRAPTPPRRPPSRWRRVAEPAPSAQSARGGPDPCEPAPRPLPRRLRRRAGGRRRAALPLAIDALGRPATRRSRRSSRRRAGADPRPVPLAARAQPRRRARRADPLAGAGRAGRAPARLGPADADADAEARRRPARGRGARPAPGARAARLARGDGPPPATDAASPRRCEPPPRRSRTPTASRSRSSRSATAELDEPRRGAASRAAREALTNAAKFAAEAGPISRLRARSSPSAIEVFVRDRGPGFDPDAVPADRRGVRESIVGRMERHGGHATIVSVPGAGTEVELVDRERDAG